jgi:hypothetical protein
MQANFLRRNIRFREDSNVWDEKVVIWRHFNFKIIFFEQIWLIKMAVFEIYMTIYRTVLPLAASLRTYISNERQVNHNIF